MECVARSSDLPRLNSFARAFCFDSTCYSKLSSVTCVDRHHDLKPCLDDETGQQRNKVAEDSGERPTALVRQAVGEWLKRRGKPQRPAEVLAFNGMADIPPFEARRDRLKPPVADPVHEVSA